MTGHCDRMRHSLDAIPVCARPRRQPADRQTELNASVVKLVDTMDSKSIAFTGVAVRVRPLVPFLNNIEPLSNLKVPYKPRYFDICSR